MTRETSLMIARLAAGYRQGRLTPFLGAGMSVPTCRGWAGFVDELWVQAYGKKPPGKAGTSLSDQALIRRANTAIRHLRLRGEPTVPQAVQAALKGDATVPLPEQTKALALTFWPLVLTSNYDALFAEEWNRAQSATGSRLQIMGRSAADCRKVLTSLHASRPPILWALQGYIGELQGPAFRERLRFVALEKQAGGFLPSTGDGGRSLKEMGDTFRAAQEKRRREFDDQLVVGHEEYRRVTFTEPQFRRAFAEVFRSRSLLFLGSSLSDQYLLNLFGEALEIFGVNPFPHYALIKRGSADPEFLRSRLNTFVLEYEDHSDLPEILRALHHAIEHDSARVRRWSYSLGDSQRAAPEKEAADIHIIRGELTPPREGECVALGAHVKEDGGIRLRRGEKDIVRKMGCLAKVQSSRFPKGELTLRIEGAPLFLFAATAESGRLDLRRYSRAIASVLDAVEPTEFACVRTRLPLSDKRDTGDSKLFQFFKKIGDFFAGDFPLRFWFAEILRVYGQWRRAKGKTDGVELAVHLTDPGVLFDMSTARIDPLELLMCDDLRFTVEVDHGTNTLVSETYRSEPEVNLGTLARDLRILGASDTNRTADRWLVEVDPSPTGFPHILRLSDKSALNTTLSELGVVSDAVLRFVRHTTTETVPTTTVKTGQSAPGKTGGRNSAPGTTKK